MSNTNAENKQPLQTKICKGCNIEKELELFYNSSRGIDGKERNCKLCRKERRRKKRRSLSKKKKKIYLSNSSERGRRNLLKREYNLTVQDYDKMVEKQKGLCAICLKPETASFKGKTKRLSIDHDHKTEKVRGLLCGRCNNFIGLAKEDIEILLRAMGYLSKHKHEWSN